MKKIEDGNKKITEYFQAKGIPPLTRILNTSNLGKLASNQVRKVQTKERVEQQSDDACIRIDDDAGSKEACKQLILIGPRDTNYYSSWQNRLRILKDSYSQQEFLKFVLENARFHYINNLTILQSIKDPPFWNETVPKMLQYASSQEKQQSISSCIPTLPSNISRVIELTRAQVLMILISMFLCTLPWQTFRQHLSFSTLMARKQKDTESTLRLKEEKLKCFINYFKIALDSDYLASTQQTISVQRVGKEYGQATIMENTSSLSEVVVKRGLIEDEYKRSVMVDFANRNIGGGVLSNGAVQEEILFCIFPELVAVMPLCEQIGQNQALLVSDARKINRYSGYSEQFKFEGTWEGAEGKFPSVILAIDAIDYSEKICKGQSQYTSGNIKRQIMKALVGIEGAELLAGLQMPICTGRWGCGAFRGDVYLKFLIQWVACSIAKRSMVYMAQTDEQHHQLNAMIRYLKKHDISEVLESMTEYNAIMKKNKKISFLSFLKQFMS